MPGKVKVKIVAGRDLPVMDRSNDTTDAYVEVKLGSCTHKTDVCRKSLNPLWNSEWFLFEMDDFELQDEPLQIRLMDYDTYSANDAIGKVYLDLSPLLNTTTKEGSGKPLSGWIPVYDTMHGIRGEVNLIVKVELFSDFNKFRQSSCGVKFFFTQAIPEGFYAHYIYGFVEELVVNDDPEYQWIDKIRTPRASNEARQTLFSKLSGELQRRIGLKALELGGNSVIGYRQCFDLEGESGIVVRGIGTAVYLRALTKQYESLNSPIESKEYYLGCEERKRDTRDKDFAVLDDNNDVNIAANSKTHKNTSRYLTNSYPNNCNCKMCRRKCRSKSHKQCHSMTDPLLTNYDENDNADKCNSSKLQGRKKISGIDSHQKADQPSHSRSTDTNSNSFNFKPFPVLTSFSSPKSPNDGESSSSRDHLCLGGRPNYFKAISYKPFSAFPLPKSPSMNKSILHESVSVTSVASLPISDVNPTYKNVDMKESLEVHTIMSKSSTLSPKNSNKSQNMHFLPLQSTLLGSALSLPSLSKISLDDNIGGGSKGSKKFPGFFFKDSSESPSEEPENSYTNFLVARRRQYARKKERMFSKGSLQRRVCEDPLLNESIGETDDADVDVKGKNLKQELLNFFFQKKRRQRSTSEECEDEENKNLDKNDDEENKGSITGSIFRSKLNTEGEEDENEQYEYHNNEGSEMICHRQLFREQRVVAFSLGRFLFSSKRKRRSKKIRGRRLRRSISESYSVGSYSLTESLPSIRSEVIYSPVDRAEFIEALVTNTTTTTTTTTTSDSNSIMDFNFNTNTNKKREFREQKEWENSREASSSSNFTSNSGENVQPLVVVAPTSTSIPANTDSSNYVANPSLPPLSPSCLTSDFSKTLQINTSAVTNNNNTVVNNHNNIIDNVLPNSYRSSIINNNNSSSCSTTSSSNNGLGIAAVVAVGGNGNGKKIFKGGDGCGKRVTEGGKGGKKKSSTGLKLFGVGKHSSNNNSNSSYPYPYRSHHSYNSLTKVVSSSSSSKKEHHQNHHYKKSSIIPIELDLNLNLDCTPSIPEESPSPNVPSPPLVVISDDDHQLKIKNTTTTSTCTDFLNISAVTVTTSVSSTNDPLCGLESSTSTNHKQQVTSPNSSQILSKSIHSPIKQNFQAPFSSYNYAAGAANILNRRQSESDLSTPPKGGKGILVSVHRPAFNAEHLTMLEYPFLTIKQWPQGFIQSLGGTVTARSVKLLERISNLEEPESRDSWWTEIRMEIRSHSRSIGCNVVLGYEEKTTMCDDVCILSASGTAALINNNYGDIGLDPPFKLNEKPGRNPSNQENQHINGHKFSNNSKSRHGSDGSNDISSCSLCHIPYNDGSVPFPVKMTRCSICKKGRVPDLLMTTVDLPSYFQTVGKCCLIQAQVFRQKKDTKGEVSAKEVSDSLPFLEYELHRRLINKLRVLGMNAIFALDVNISLGDKLLVAVATGTAIYLSALPSPQLPVITAGNLKADLQRVAQFQKMIHESFEKNREFYELTSQISNGTNPNSADFDKGDSRDESEEEITNFDLVAGNKDAYVLEIDDAEDIDIISALIEHNPPLPGLFMNNLEYAQGFHDFKPIGQQMFTQVWRCKVPTLNLRQFTYHFDQMIRSAQFKLRRMKPCVLTKMKFRVELPEADEIQLSLIGVAVGFSLEKISPSSTKQAILEDPELLTDNLLDQMNGNGKPKDIGSLSPINIDSETKTISPTNNVAIASSSLGVSPTSKSYLVPKAPTFCYPVSTNVFPSKHSSKSLNAQGRVSIERYSIEITPCSHIAGSKISKYLGNLNFFFIRETTSLRENGGLSGFVQNFIAEVLAMIRAHVAALGGNAMVSYFMTELALLHNPHKNQGQILINVGGDAVLVNFLNTS